MVGVLKSVAVACLALRLSGVGPTDETDRSPQLHELRVSCWLDLTRSAARWREPAAACLAGHNYAALASYTPAVYSTPSS